MARVTIPENPATSGSALDPNGTPTDIPLETASSQWSLTAGVSSEDQADLVKLLAVDAGGGLHLAKALEIQQLATMNTLGRIAASLHNIENLLAAMAGE